MASRRTFLHVRAGFPLRSVSMVSAAMTLIGTHREAYPRPHADATRRVMSRPRVRVLNTSTLTFSAIQRERTPKTLRSGGELKST